MAVDDIVGDGDVGVLAQLGQVLASVVSAEQQLATRVKASAHVGLGAAAVAAVGRGHRGCQCSGHVSLPFVAPAGAVSLMRRGAPDFG